MAKEISGHTGLLAVIGSPVSHSGSPRMHNFSFRYLDLDYVYLAFDIREHEMKDMMRTVRLLNMRGCNVTMPGKIAVMPYLDRIDKAAELVGAVNTIVNDNGILTGYSTDGEGFVLNLREHGTDVAGKKIAVAGAGGAATAIQVQCALRGAEAVSILQRKGGASYERAVETAEKIRNAVPACRTEVIDLGDTDAVTACVLEADIFANGTNLGMKPREDTTPLRDTAAFHSGLVVADAVYEPEQTRLLREAEQAHCRTIDGSGMLLWQGAEAFRLFTGMEMPVEAYRQYCKESVL